jgi:hypothetical protein
MYDATTDRSFLLGALARFIRAARTVPGVTRVAVIGSLATDKASPKDADALVSVRDDADLGLLSRLGRQLKGAAQTRNRGADIFLASQAGDYLGRTCSYRQCHVRAACRGTQCGSGRLICTDLAVITLPKRLIAEPPLEVWPTLIVRTTLPADTYRILIGEEPHRGDACEELAPGAGSS